VHQEPSVPTPGSCEAVKCQCLILTKWKWQVADEKHCHQLMFS